MKRIFITCAVFCLMLVAHAVAAPVYNNQNEVDKLTAFGIWRGFEPLPEQPVEEEEQEGEDASDNSEAEEVPAPIEGDAPVSRAEFARLINNMLGFSEFDLINSEIRTFSDVPEEHADYVAIMNLRSIFLVSGDDKNSFRPDQPIAFNEAVKMVIGALGYSNEAELKGGYPDGYLTVAMSRGLYPRAISGAQFLTRDNAAILLCNTATKPIAKKVTYGAVIETREVDSVTPLSEYHDIHKIEGVLNGMGTARINKGRKLGFDEVDIAGLVYDCAIPVRDYLGQYVTAFIRIDSTTGIGAVCYIETKEGRNELLVISSDDFGSYSNNTLYYERNNRPNVVPIEPSILVLYNDGIVVDFNPSLFDNLEELTLIDNDMNGSYDVMVIEALDIFVSTVPDTTNFILYDKYRTTNNVLKLDMFDESYKINMVDYMGNPSDFSYIIDGSVVSAGISQEYDGVTSIRAIVSNNKVNGMVTEMNPSENTITIDGVEYDLAANWEDITEYKTLNVGDSGVFSLDYRDRIAGMNITGTSGIVYGYLINAKKEGTLGGEITMKMLTAGGKIEIMETTARVSVSKNGIASNVSGDALLELMTTQGEGDEKDELRDGKLRQLIRYSKNAEDKIRYIELYSTNTDNSAFGYPHFSRYMPNGTFPSGYYINQIMLYSGSFGITSSTTVFVVPLNDVDIDDDNNFAVKNQSYFIGHRNYPGSDEKMELFDMSMERKARVVVYYSKEPSASSKIIGRTPAMIVTGFSESKSSDETIVKVVKGIVGGAELSIPISPKYTINEKDTPKVGDMIRYGTDAVGEMNRCQKLFSLRDEVDPTTMKNDKNALYMVALSTGKYAANGHKSTMIEHHKSGSDEIFNSLNSLNFYGSEFRALIGYVEDVIGNTMVLAVPTTDDTKTYRREIVNAGSFRYHTLDEARGIVLPASRGELATANSVGWENCSLVVVTMSSGNPRDCAIVKRIAE